MHLQASVLHRKRVSMCRSVRYPAPPWQSLFSSMALAVDIMASITVGIKFYYCNNFFNNTIIPRNGDVTLINVLHLHNVTLLTYASPSLLSFSSGWFHRTHSHGSRCWTNFIRCFVPFEFYFSVPSNWQRSLIFRWVHFTFLFILPPSLLTESSPCPL